MADLPSDLQIDAAVPASGTPHRGNTNTLLKDLRDGVQEVDHDAQQAASNVGDALTTHKSSADHDARYLRKDVTQSAPDLTDIPQSGVVHLPYDLDQHRAKLNSILYPSGPIPSFDQVFSHGASMLDPRWTYSRSTPAAYIDDFGVLRTADVNEPVFEDGALRLRPQETNLFKFSQDFSNAAWLGRPRISLAPDAGLGPDRMNQAYRLTSVAASGNTEVNLTQTIIYPGDNKSHTVAYFVKKETGRYLRLGFDYSDSNFAGYEFDLNDYSVGSHFSLGAFAATNPQMRRMADGWCLISVKVTNGVHIGNLYPSLVATNKKWEGGRISSVSDPAGETALIFGAQPNAGDLAPYIPTTSAQATRAADNLALQGEAFASVFNPSEGAIILDLESTVLGGSMLRLRTAAGVTRLYWNNLSAWGLSIGTSGNIALETLVPGVRKKIAIAWDSTGCSIYRNSALIRTVTPSEFNFSDVALMDVFNGAGGRIYRPHIFPRRPPDVEMEALTS